MISVINAEEGKKEKMMKERNCEKCACYNILNQFCSEKKGSTKPTDHCAYWEENDYFLIENKLKHLHSVYKNYLHIEDTDRIDIVLAVALSKDLPGIPLWLFIVGPSGDMKSVQLEALEGLEDSYILPKITSKTLVNGYKDKEEHPDLAPKLNGKLIIIRDMAPLLKLPPVEKGEVWGQLRDLYDGFAGAASGMGMDVKYKGIKTTFIAGSTPTIDAQILVHQDLGTRELIYRTKGNISKDKVMNKCFENEEHEVSVKNALKDVTTRFLTCIQPRREEITDEVMETLKEISIYISYMRALAEIDQYTNTLRNDVYPEEPTRIAKQIKRLYICLKSLSLNYSDEDAIRILWKVAKSSAFPVRTKIFEHLLNTTMEFSTSHMAKIIHIGKSTATKELQIMWNMGLVNRRDEATTYPDKFNYYWEINQDHVFIENQLRFGKDKLASLRI